jgi:hypothetical protein
VIKDDDSPIVQAMVTVYEQQMSSRVRFVNMRTLEHHPETHDIIICPTYGTSLQLPVTDHPNEMLALLDLKECLHQSYEFRSMTISALCCFWNLK